MGIPAYWRTRTQRYALVGEVCHKCGAKIFPPRDVCPECARPASDPFTFSGRGEGFEEFAPYTVALVKLEEGPLVTAQLTDVDPAEVHIGMPVEMVTRKLREEGEEGQIIYGYKFRPLLRSTLTPRPSGQAA
jgi:uncharacterized OB-fold protein